MSKRPPTPMRVEHVQARVIMIYENRNDDEAAHCMEDTLFEDVLRAIAKGTNIYHARNLANAALKSTEIPFKRLCS